MGKLNGEIALVTGASKGIGAGVALSLAKGGRCCRSELCIGSRRRRTRC